MSTSGVPMADHPGEQLSAYLDGELAGDARRQVEDHVRACGECATLLRELSEVVSRARALEPAPPAVDLWEGVAARLDEQERPAPAPETTPAPPAPVVSMPRRDRLGRRFTMSIPQLAAASVAIAALSGSLVWWALGPKAGSRQVAMTAPGVTAGPRPSTSESTATQAPVEVATPSPRSRAAVPPMATLASAGGSARYDQAVAELQDVLSRHRGELDPRTVQLVQANLAAIDAAIQQARAALRADPSNPYLNDHLAQQMKRKVRVLQQAAELVAVNYTDTP